MKNFVISALIALGVGACAHHDNTVKHHHHEGENAAYDGQCAHSVAHNEIGVAGKPEFRLEHEGLIYYFSSAEKLEEFKKDPHKNSELANRMWQNRGSKR